MKKLFIRALKDLHKLESRPVMDGISPPAKDAFRPSGLARHVRRLVRHELDDARFFSVSAAQLSTSTVGLYAPDEMTGEGFTRTIMSQAVDEPAAQRVLDALASSHGNSCDAVAFDGEDTRSGSHAADSQAREVGGQRAIPSPKIPFALRIQSIPDDLDGTAELPPNADDCADTRGDTAAGPNDGGEDVLDADALIEASKNRTIIIPPASAFVNLHHAAADKEDPTATVSADTIERLPADAPNQFLAADILVPPSHVYPELRNASACEKPADEPSLAAKIGPERDGIGHELPTTGPPSDGLSPGEDVTLAPDAGEVPMPVAAGAPQPYDLDDESAPALEGIPDTAVNTTPMKRPREKARYASPHAPRLVAKMPQLRAGELATESFPLPESPRPSNMLARSAVAQKHPSNGHVPQSVGQPGPSPPGLPAATAFENDVRDRLRQSTNLTQFQELAGRLTRGFSRDFAGTVAVAHLDEVQHTLQVILSVARVLGTNKEIKTLLVDADLNHKNLSKYLNVDRYEGFGEACDCVQLCPHLIRPTATADVSILPAGHFADPTGPGLDRVRRLLSTLARGAFSVVLIDAGELLNPLTKKVCTAADAAHLLVRLGRTERAYAAQAIHLSGVRFAGCIITNVPQIS